ncbi:MAG TPA: metallopeptidase TldD-related protein [Pseudonocardia sp.]|jgi:predicted Zn-dependent protease|nr:metallopeptidase TldD-related protein [Pseudonocardia sp.]
MRALTSAELVERVLAVPGGPNSIGRVVLVTEDSEAALRWANNTMTTNGHATSVNWTVISLVALSGDNGGTGAGVVSSSALVTDPASVEDAVRASEAAAVSSGPARDAAPLPEPGATVGEPWDDPAPGTSIEVFGRFAPKLADAFDRARSGKRILYGFAHHQVATTWLGTSTGVRLRWTQPTGSVEVNAKTADLAHSAWGGRSAATARDFDALDVAGLDAELAKRLAWGDRRMELPAGRYPTILPPACVADLMTYMCWEMAGRPAQEGRSAFSAPPGAGAPTRLGERLNTLPLTLSTDPGAGDGLGCSPFLAATHSSDEVSVFDNGAGLRRVDWVADGVLNALAYPRAAATEFGAEFTAPADNLILTGNSDTPLEELVSGAERGLLLTCLWYIRMVDPASLLLTGLTRDGVYLVENGEVVGEVNNFRFNESPLDILRRVTAVGVSERTLPREFKDWFTRTVMPAMVVPDFNMSSVSQAS